MEKWISIACGLLLLFLAAFAWGWQARDANVFPNSLITEYITPLRKFVRGGEGDRHLSAIKKLANDLGGEPHRLLVSNPKSTTLDHRRRVSFADKRPRRHYPQMLTRKGSPQLAGYFLMFGTIDAEEALHGILVFDHDGTHIQTIPIQEEFVARNISSGNEGVPKSFEYIPPAQRFPHGLEVLQDGSLVFNDGDGGNTIRRIDWCGKPLWTVYRRTGHAVNIANDELWHLQTGSLVKRDPETGEVRRKIPWQNVVSANSELGILDMRHRIQPNVKLKDTYHLNDIDPLPAELASAYPSFEKGDLLISARSLNLVFVMDPETLRAKWWHVGGWRRQHDPEWMRDGKISIYDNQMVPRGQESWSRIVQIDPKNDTREVAYDGRKHNVYSAIRGKHQILRRGGIVMTVPQQGRAIIVNETGKLKVDFRNKYSKNKNLLVSEMRYVRPSFFNFDPHKRTCH
jgi:hypothetical protein